MAFDQMMLSFDHYCVVGAKIQVNFHNTSTSSTVGVGIALNSTNATTTNYQQLIENGNMVRDRLVPTPSDDSAKTLEMGINIARFIGIPQPLDAEELWGTISSNPTEQAYFHIAVWNPDGVTVVSNIIMEVFIVFDVWFLEPRKNSLSLNSAIRRLILSEEKKKEM